MTWYVHINRQVIDANRKHNRDDPPVRFQRGKSGRSTYAHEVEFTSGARVIYDSAGSILKCGARLVIVSETEPKVIR